MMPRGQSGSHGQLPAPAQLWPIALTWYANANRVALFVDVSVHERRDGSVLYIPEIGDLLFEESVAPPPVEFGAPLMAVAILRHARAPAAILGRGTTSDEALEDALEGVADAFISEVGARGARIISAVILNNDPLLASRQFAWLVARHLIQGSGTTCDQPDRPVLSRTEIASIVDTGRLPVPGLS